MEDISGVTMDFATPLEELPPEENVAYYTTPYDENHLFDFREAPEYAASIIQYMRYREKDFVINEDYMSKIQTSITWNMRATLVDWLVEVGCGCDLSYLC